MSSEDEEELRRLRWALVGSLVSFSLATFSLGLSLAVCLG